MNLNTSTGKTTLIAPDSSFDFNKTQSKNLRPADRMLYYRDVAILRYWNKKTRVNSETQFTITFLKRQNDQIWKELMVVQTNIKAKIGIGKILNITFYAPILSEDQEEPIEYDFNRMGEDSELDQQEICHKQCLII